MHSNRNGTNSSAQKVDTNWIAQGLDLQESDKCHLRPTITWPWAARVRSSVGPTAAKIRPLYKVGTKTWTARRENTIYRIRWRKRNTWKRKESQENPNLDRTDGRILRHLQTRRHCSQIPRFPKEEENKLSTKEEKKATGGEGFDHAGSAALEISENVFSSPRIVRSDSRVHAYKTLQREEEEEEEGKKGIRLSVRICAGIEGEEERERGEKGGFSISRTFLKGGKWEG